MLSKLVVRNDNAGKGDFYASRGTRQHNGTDYLVNEGQEILAPEKCKVVRLSNPYPEAPKWKGLLLKGLSTGYEYKVFYMIPLAGIVGKVVDYGEVIGHAQAISEKYSSAMKNHIHVYMWDENGKLLNPENYLKDVKSLGQKKNILDFICLCGRCYSLEIKEKN